MAIAPFGFIGTSGYQGPGTTAITDSLEIYYDFGASNWYTGTADYITNHIVGGLTGILTGGNGYNSGFGGYMAFNAATSRQIDMRRDVSGLGLTSGPNSIVFTVRGADTSGDKMVIGTSAAATTNTSLHCGIRNTSFYRGHFSNDFSGGTFAANTWYHVVFTQSGSTSSLYVNGSFVRSDTQTYISGSNATFIGRWVAGYYTFDLGSFMIYSKALSSTEITTLYNEQGDRFGI